MSQKKRTIIKRTFYEFFTNFGSLLGWFFTFLPTSGLWMGMMAVPAFSYIYYLFRYGFSFTIGWQSYAVAMKISLVCIFCFLYCFVYLLVHRIKKKTLITSGPYKRIRHPQYLAILLLIIIMTFSLTLNLHVTPIWPDLSIPSIGQLYIIMGIEIFIYFILMLIEEYSLKNRFPEIYTLYRKQSWALFPKPILTKSSIKRTTPIILGWCAFLCTGMPHYERFWIMPYTAVIPLGYLLYFYIFQVTYYPGLEEFLLSDWLWWTTLSIALIAIILVMGLQIRIRMLRKKFGSNPSVLKTQTQFRILSYIIFLFSSLVLNLISLFSRRFKINPPYYLAPGEISPILHCILIGIQVIVFVGLILYEKKQGFHNIDLQEPNPIMDM